MNTKFDNTEPKTVTYANYYDVGSGSNCDTYDGWVWQYTPNIPTYPSQEYRIGGGLELQPTNVVGGDTGNWMFGWGQQELRLTQSFAATAGSNVTVQFQWSSSSGNSALDIDTGTGFTQVMTATGAAQTYTFTTSGSSFGVRFASQRGADNSNELLFAKVDATVAADGHPRAGDDGPAGPGGHGPGRAHPPAAGGVACGGR